MNLGGGNNKLLITPLLCMSCHLPHTRWELAAQWAGAFFQEGTQSRVLTPQLEVTMRKRSAPLSWWLCPRKSKNLDGHPCPFFHAWLSMSLPPCLLLKPCQSHRGDIETEVRAGGWSVCTWSPFPVIGLDWNLHYLLFHHYCSSKCVPGGYFLWWPPTKFRTNVFLWLSHYSNV